MKIDNQERAFSAEQARRDVLKHSKKMLARLMQDQTELRQRKKRLEVVRV